VAILSTLALTDADELALAVDVRHPQIGELRNPQPGGIDGHEDRAVFEVLRHLEQCPTSEGLKPGCAKRARRVLALAHGGV
jgi:hypothetical protein